MWGGGVRLSSPGRNQPPIFPRKKPASKSSLERNQPPNLPKEETSLQIFPRKEPASKASLGRNLAAKTSQGRNLAAKYPKWDVRDSGPHHGTHRNISGKTPIQYRLIPEPFRNPKTTFLYMKLYLRAIPELLCDIPDPIRDSEQPSVSPL